MPSIDKKAILWIVAVLAVVATVIAAGFHLTELPDRLMALQPGVLVAAMAVLPVIGFPVTAIDLVAGAKFGLIEGGVVIGGITAFHLIVTHLLARTILRKPLEGFLSRHRHRLPDIPPDAGISVSAIVVLLPGIPYLARNLFLALSGISLRTYFWVCVPIYILRSYAAIVIGDIGWHPTARQLATAGGILVVQLAVCALLLRHLRARSSGGQKTEDGGP